MSSIVGLKSHEALALHLNGRGLLPIGNRGLGIRAIAIKEYADKRRSETGREPALRYVLMVIRRRQNATGSTL